jgi:hypothetical protein
VSITVHKRPGPSLIATIIRLIYYSLTCSSTEPKVKTLITEVEETGNTTENTPRYFTLLRLDTPVQEDPSGHLANYVLTQSAWNCYWS